MSETSSPGARPTPQVWPTLRAKDARALIDFYVEVFGFVTVVEYADGDLVAHAQLAWPEGGGIMLGSHRTGDAWSLAPGTFGAYVVTDHLEDVYARVQAAGVRITTPLTEPSYGGREFGVADPEGNLWSFGTYRGEPRS